MKSILLTIIAVLFSGVVWGQTEEMTIRKNGNYYLDPSIILTDNLFTRTDKSKVSADVLSLLKGKNYKLRVKNVAKGVVYFEFWNFKNRQSSVQKKINGENEDVIYEMSEEDFKKITSIYYNRVDWRVGAFTVPFKLRFNDFDFTSNINLGTSLGARVRIDRHENYGFSLEPVLGIAATGVTVDKSNSNAEDPSNLFAFSANTGLLIHITQNINLGFLYGFDFLSSKDQKKYEWQHNGKGWLGVGINVSFAAGSGNTGAGGTNNGK